MSNIKTLIEKVQTDPTSITPEERRQIVLAMGEITPAFQAAVQAMATVWAPFVSAVVDWAAKERDTEETR